MKLPAWIAILSCGLTLAWSALAPARCQAQSATIRINSGGWPSEYVDAGGRAWAPDAFFGPVDRGHTAGFARPGSLPIRARANQGGPVVDEPLYLSARRGTRIRYRIPAGEGLHTLRLFFVELEFDEAGKRLFDIEVNGETVVSGIDIFSEAGKLEPLVKELQASSRNGQIEIVLSALPGLWRNAAVISAIELVPVDDGELRISPGVATLAPGESQQFQATRAGEPVPAQWSLSQVDDAGEINENGVYQSPPSISGARTIVVRASEADDELSSAVAIVNLRSPVRVSINPEDPVVESERSIQFESRVRGTASAHVLWSAASGSILEGGLYTAPASGRHQVDEVVAASSADPAARASATVLVTPLRQPRESAEFFVAPNGSPANDGSRERPWDLRTALSAPAAVNPGDIIWLRGGVYGEESEPFESVLAGEPGRPIVVRQYPGERARVRGWLSIRGPHAWYWGFEVFSDIEDRSESRPVSDGVDVYDEADYVKLINLIIHDRRNGVGLWDGAEGAEVYGCIIYHNGVRGETRGRYHGIYSQNESGVKKISDNIIFNQFGFGIQMYGSPTAFVQGYRVDGNVMFNNGILYDPAQRVDNLLVGGAQLNPKRDIRITSNFSFHTLGLGAGSSRIGLNWDEQDSLRPGSPNEDVSLRGNYWVGGQSAVQLWLWDDIEFESNTVVADSGYRVFLRTGVDTDVRSYYWDKNVYYGSGEYWLDSNVVGFDSWRARTGFDRESQSFNGRPGGVWTFFRPNRYDADRGHLVVYNWDGGESVAVDLSDFLASGDSFEILDSQSLFGEPILAGRYQGGEVNVPMAGDTVAAPAGLPAPAHTGPGFGAFVVLRTAEGAQR